jgi:hypothetical protein
VAHRQSSAPRAADSDVSQVVCESGFAGFALVLFVRHWFTAGLANVQDEGAPARDVRARVLRGSLIGANRP